MTQRQQDFEKWLATFEWQPGRVYSAAVRSNYPRQLLYQISDEFKIPNVTSLFEVLDIETLNKIEKKYLFTNFVTDNRDQAYYKKVKLRQDYISAFHSYLKFCKHNEDLFNENPNEESISDFVSKTEGKKKVVISVQAERDQSLRKAALRYHKYTCKVCEFNFFDKYGKWGENFIEVHHIRPLSSITSGQVLTNFKTDLTVVCSNCHKMIHKKKGITLTIEELKAKLTK